MKIYLSSVLLYFFLLYNDVIMNKKIIENISHIKNTKLLSQSDLFSDGKKIISQEKEDFFVLHKSFLELLSQYSSYDVEASEENIKMREKIRAASLIGSEQNLITRLKNYEFLLVKRHKVTDMQLYEDVNGKLYCSPITLEHNRANLHDGNYFIDDFLEKLSKRDDVALCSFDHSNNQSTFIKCPLVEDSSVSKLLGKVIYDIEHHLEENEEAPIEKEGFTIKYYPQQDEIKKIKDFYHSFHHINEERMLYYKEKIYNIQEFIVRKILCGDEFYKHHPKEEIIIKRKFKN